MLADFDFPFFRSILFGPSFLLPALLVLYITLVAQTAGVILGLPLALMRISKNALVRAPANFYLLLFRGTPLFLQILFVYDATAQLTNNSHLLDFINHDPVTSGIVALTLNEAAYMAEIIRSGLQAVDAGQTEAAKALGMSRGLYLRRIIIPQALRVVVPPTTNEYINMSKNTSLLFIIGVNELLSQASRYYSTNFKYFEALTVAAVWYILITTVLTRVQAAIERRFGERQDPGGGDGFATRMFLGVRGRKPLPAIDVPVGP